MVERGRSNGPTGASTPSPAPETVDTHLDDPPIGAYLRSQRELRGMTLSELAAQTRIPIRSLERLEAGSFDGQNDGFVRGFVRTVGAGLGLDPDDTVARTLTEPAHEDRRGLDFSGRGLQFLVGFVLILILGVGALWVRDGWTTPDRMPPGQVNEIVHRRDPVRALAEAQAAANPAASGAGPADVASPAAAAGTSGP